MSSACPAARCAQRGGRSQMIYITAGAATVAAVAQIKAAASLPALSLLLKLCSAFCLGSLGCLCLCSWLLNVVYLRMPPGCQLDGHMSGTLHGEGCRGLEWT